MAKRKSPKSIALMIRPASLPAETKALIQVATPTEFIKQRPGRGNKTFTYVEGGYVVARLNQIFSPVGWNFEVVKERIEATEVVVRGRLTIKDHKNGYQIAKDQYGTKERNAGVPLGDTLKAAATDCLKKCASLFGIALDVYWPQLDEDKLPAGVIKGLPKKSEKVVENQTLKPQKIKKDQVLKMLVDKIKSEKDQTILSQYFEKITANPNFTQEERVKLIKVIADQRKQNVKNSQGQNQLL